MIIVDWFETTVFAHELDEEGNPITTEETSVVSHTHAYTTYSNYILTTGARMLPLIITIVLIYLIMVRPHRNREKKKKNEIDNIKVGDTVVTIGGVCGKVIDFEYNYVFIEIGIEGSHDIKPFIKVKREAIESVEKRGEA